MSAFRPWLIWFIAGLFYLYEFIHRVAPSVMVPELMQDFNASASQLGTISACYYYAYAIMQIPVGLLLDRFNTRYLLSFAALLVTAGSFAFSLTEHLFVAQFSRVLIGIGSAFSFVGCLKLAAAWFSTKRFTFVIGLTNLLGVFGALLGGKPLSELLGDQHWRDALFYSGILGIIFTVLLYFFIQQPQTENSTTTHPYTLLKITETLKNTQIWWIALCGGLMVLPIAAFSELWGVPYLMLKYNLARPLAAELSSSTFVGIACGGPLIGFLTGFVQQKKDIVAFGAFGAFIVTALLFYGPIFPIKLNFILYFLLGFFTSSMLLCFALNCAQAEANLHATIIAFTNMLVMAGSVISQPLIGYFLDKSAFGFELAPFQTAFILLPACQLLAAVILIRLNNNSSK